MRNLVYNAALLTTLILGTSGAFAQEWQTSSGPNPQGLEAASMFVQKHEFAMEFHCDEHDWEDHRLSVKFIGPALPRLSGEDGDEAKLSLLFTLRDGVLYREVWNAYYFDGGLGDQAWLGNINAGKSEFNALARAMKLDILNQDGELVYSFGTKGTAAGAAVLSQTCRFGHNEAATAPIDKNPPASLSSSDLPPPTDQLSYKK